MFRQRVGLGHFGLWNGTDACSEVQGKVLDVVLGLVLALKSKARYWTMAIAVQAIIACAELQVSPDSRQAQALKQAVEDQIVKEGLIGVGIAGGVLGVAAVIVGGLLSARR